MLKYCPKCGKETLNWDGEKKWSCNDCDFVLFHNVAGAVAVLIIHEDELMFTRRNQQPGKGKLDLPGGFTDPEESAETTCKREIFEELKINIAEKNLKYLGSLPNVYHYKNIDYNTLDLFYSCEIQKKFEPVLELSEISEICWLKKEEITLNEIAFDSQKKFLESYLNL